MRSGDLIAKEKKKSIILSIIRLKKKRNRKAKSLPPAPPPLLPEMISSCSRCYKHETAIVSYSHIFFSCLVSSTSCSSALSLQPFPQLCLLGQEMEMETLMKFLLLLPRVRASSGILEAFLELLNASREKNKFSCSVLVLSNWTLISLYVLQGKKAPLTVCLSVCRCVHMMWGLNSDWNLKTGHKIIKRSSYSLNALCTFPLFTCFLLCIVVSPCFSVSYTVFVMQWSVKVFKQK